MIGTKTARPIGQLYLSSIRSYRYRAADGDTMKERLCRSCAIGFVTQGKGLIAINGTVHTAEKGDVFLLEPGMRVAGKSRVPNGIRYTVILFSCVQVSKRGGEWHAERPCFEAAGKLQGIQDMRAVEEAINRLSEYGCGTSSPQRQAERKHELHRLLLLLAEAGSPMRQSPAEETTGMERALAYLQQNFAKDIKVDQLARMAGLSTNHFLRTFKYRMDMTPMEYVRKQRMTEAKKRLFSSDTIKEVARQVGYPDEHYFSRVFKKAEGVAPTLYMKSSSRRIAALYYGLDDYLITLGHGPVAALSYEERVSRSYPVPSLSEHNPAVVLDLPTLNYDKLIRSKPDLILTSDRVERDAALDRIAPTLLLKHSNDYEKVLGHIADVLGKERQAAAWVDRFSERKHSLQRKIRSRWGQPTVYYIRVSPTFYRIYGAMNQTGSLLYRDLGLRLPEAFPSRQWAIDFQLRDLALLNADHIFLMADPTDLARRQLQLLLQSEQWLALDAVKHRRVHDASDLLFKALGPTGRSWAMERIARQLGVEPG